MQTFVDYYEVLQLSPNADFDTVQRVYRLLAQRFHPDNQDTGNNDVFKQVLEAYKVLSDPEQRAAFDVEYKQVRSLMWKIFDQPKAAMGVQAEKRKRMGILSLLYTKRMTEAGNPGMRMRELEELLGCPREHLEFSLWYLRENGLVTRTDYGHFTITVKGVDEAEKSGDGWVEQFKLLPAPASHEGSNGTAAHS
jgi:curved DNA-binding protein CbpA